MSGKKIFKAFSRAGNHCWLLRQTTHSLSKNALLEWLFVTQGQPGFLLYLLCSAVTQTLSISQETSPFRLLPFSTLGIAVPTLKYEQGK